MGRRTNGIDDGVKTFMDKFLSRVVEMRIRKDEVRKKLVFFGAKSQKQFNSKIKRSKIVFS